VPRLAVSGSLALAVASVGVLIYFIHHLARSIQYVQAVHPSRWSGRPWTTT
jgi:uncharacterized membrane protein